jgi:hypothetical protein
VRNESLSRDQKVSEPFAVGAADTAGADVLAEAAGADVPAGAGADVAAPPAAELVAGLAVLLFEEQAEVRRTRARPAAATPAHCCLAFILCLTSLSNRLSVRVRYSLPGSQTRIGPLVRLAHK